MYENLENLTNRYSRKVKLNVSLRYGLSFPTLQALVKDIRSSLQNTLYVTEPIEVVTDGFGENVFQLIISYSLPVPLPQGATLNDIKHQVNMGVYGVLAKHNALPATSGEGSTCLLYTSRCV